jgi:hypothetical protein
MLVTFTKLGKVDSDKNHIPLVNKNQSYEEKKIESKKGEKLDDSQEDSELQRNSKLGKSADDPALIPSKLSCKLPTNRSYDFFMGGFELEIMNHHHHLYFPFIHFGYIPRDVEIVKCFR